MFRSISSICRRSLLLLLLLLLPPGAAHAEDAAPGGRLLGEWHGALDAGGRKLRLDFHITRRADGIFAGTMDSPDQGARGTAFDSVELSGDSLRLVVKLAGASYRGALDAAGATIRGIWAQSGFTFPLDLVRPRPSVCARRTRSSPTRTTRRTCASRTLRRTSLSRARSRSRAAPGLSPRSR